MGTEVTLLGRAGESAATTLQTSSTHIEDIIDKPATHDETKIIIADDHELTRESVRTMLESVASEPSFRY